MSLSPKSPNSPAKHTAVVHDVEGMFAKLQWDVDQFDEIQRSHPDLPEPLGFAAINVCISATSLRDWAVTAFVQRRRSEKKRVTRREVVEHIHKNVVLQKMCEDIANTAKHSILSAERWPKGSVSIDNDEATEDGPGGFVLRHHHEDGHVTSMALEAFTLLERSWWGELQNLGFAFAFPTPEWRRRRILAPFVDVVMTEAAR